MQKKSPLLLVVLDGFGYAPAADYNPINRHTAPFFFRCLDIFPHTTLQASGAAVGLPAGYVGNSEVGHFTLGSGTITKQPLTILNETINDGTFFKNPVLIRSFKKLAQTGKKLHIIGLLSDAGVHAHTNHMIAYIQAAQQAGIKIIVIHPFLDGRDVPQKSAALYLNQLEPYLNDSTHIGSVHGRFFAMDRDTNLERTQQSYDVLTQTKKLDYTSWQDYLNACYAQNIFDEHIAPQQLHANATINPGDGIVCTNVRAERAVQITKMLLDSTQPCFYLTPVSYTPELATTPLMATPLLTNTFKKQLADKSKSIFTIAESEKWAHVTYFFDGHQHIVFNNETRIQIPSVKTKSFALYPEMCAQQITDSVVTSLKHSTADFYLINYANADMVAHTGDFKATEQAIACLDKQLEQLYSIAVQLCDGQMVVTADHGNAECLIDIATGLPKTAHTANPVHCVYLSKKQKDQNELALTQLSEVMAFIMKQIT